MQCGHFKQGLPVPMLEIALFPPPTSPHQPTRPTFGSRERLPPPPLVTSARSGAYGPGSSPSAPGHGASKKLVPNLGPAQRDQFSMGGAPKWVWLKQVSIAVINGCGSNRCRWVWLKHASIAVIDGGGSGGNKTHRPNTWQQQVNGIKTNFNLLAPKSGRMPLFVAAFRSLQINSFPIGRCFECRTKSAESAVGGICI